MEKMNTRQELSIIRQAMTMSSYIDAGSSRAVYDLKNGFVLKVAFTSEGQEQNKTEVRLYEEMKNSIFATIAEYGKYSVVMEKVETYSMFEMCDASCGDNNKVIRKYGQGIVDQIQSVISKLNDILGNTFDNYQIGFRNGQVVAYDYGYDVQCRNKNVGKIYKDVDRFGPIGLLKELEKKILDEIF